MRLQTLRLAIGAGVLLTIASACNPIDTVRARRTAREGNTLYRAADYRGAIEKYREALALDPETPNVYINLGYALFSIYNPDSDKEEDRRAAADAVAAFESHLQQAPEDEKAKSFRIKTLLRAAPREPALADKAYALFVDLLKQHPNDVELRGYLVTLFIDCQRYKQAVEYFSEKLKEKPDDIDTMKVVAVIADKSGEPQEALKWYWKRAEVVSDPEKKALLYYELGTYAWNVLHYQPDKLAGVEAIKFADQGIEASKLAMALKKDYAEAMIYGNLLYLKRTLFETTEQGKYNSQMIAFNLRTEAAKIMGARKAATAAAEGAQGAAGAAGTEGGAGGASAANAGAAGGAGAAAGAGGAAATDSKKEQAGSGATDTKQLTNPAPQQDAGKTQEANATPEKR